MLSKEEKIQRLEHLIDFLLEEASEIGYLTCLYGPLSKKDRHINFHDMSHSLKNLTEALVNLKNMDKNND